MRHFVPDPGRLRAGVIVEQSGIYRAYHRAHRMPHNVFVPSGTRLPECQRCGDDVEFALLMAGPEVEGDYDFANGASAAGKDAA
ncbi:MAG TPA: hypothetical protein VLA96_05615 [Terriglobales bacterium]|nr:hypothetical protein [Terriglobales bacterium]